VGFSEADLITRVLQAGDPNAFGELVRRYQSPVRSFLRRLTRGDEALADDLAQETFLRAWRKLETFRAEARFSTWLFGIAVNEFRARLRRDRRQQWNEPDDRAADPEPIVEAPPAGLRLDLDEALRRLTLPERAAILLCCQHGLTHEAAAQALRSPLGTVKTNILRGKEKLRRWLEL
jgi:RNA polymerase sigma-70 factor (ECF subfamily)